MRWRSVSQGRIGRRPARKAKARERILASRASAAPVEQADAAVWAEVGLAILEVDGALATGAHAFRQARF